jgi:orotidine-5'-phosphate decarboxylase
MIFNNKIAKEIYHNNLSNRKLKQRGYFKEKNIWIAFDNSTEDLFTEEFTSEIEALLWLNNFFENSEKSSFDYLKIFKNLYFSQKMGFIRIVINYNQTKLVFLN